MSIFDTLRYPINNIYDDDAILEIPSKIMNEWRLLHDSDNTYSRNSITYFITELITAKAVALVGSEADHLGVIDACIVVEDELLADLQQFIANYDTTE